MNHFYLFSYDVADDKRRNKIAAILEDVADRVQYSVFEGTMSSATLEQTARRLAAVLDQAADSLRIYSLCKTCLNGTKSFGRRDGPALESDDAIII